MSTGTYALVSMRCENGHRYNLVRGNSSAELAHGLVSCPDCASPSRRTGYNGRVPINLVERAKQSDAIRKYGGAEPMRAFRLKGGQLVPFDRH